MKAAVGKRLAIVVAAVAIAVVVAVVAIVGRGRHESAGQRAASRSCRLVAESLDRALAGAGRRSVDAKLRDAKAAARDAAKHAAFGQLVAAIERLRRGDVTSMGPIRRYCSRFRVLRSAPLSPSDEFAVRPSPADLYLCAPAGASVGAVERKILRSGHLPQGVAGVAVDYGRGAITVRFFGGTTSRVRAAVRRDLGALGVVHPGGTTVAACG